MVVIHGVSDQVNVLDVPGGDVVGQEVRPLGPGQVEEVEGGESGETGRETGEVLIAHTELAQFALEIRESERHTERSYLCWRPG